MIPPELLAAIAAAPDDPAPRAVAADYLQERGDPHGELIALSIADPVKHAARIAELANTLVPRDWISGWMAGWRWGFLERLVCPQVVIDTLRMIPDALALPAARLLRVLVLEGPVLSPVDRGIADTMSALSPELRALVVWPTEGGGGIVTIAVDGARSPKLESLALRVHVLEAPLAIPTLGELTLATSDLRVLRDARLPNLHTLRLKTREVPNLDTILDPADFPALRHLAIATGQPDESIANARITSQLDVFELIDTAGYDRGRRRFLRDRPSGPRAALFDLWNGRVVMLDPDVALPLERVTLEWSGVDWWVRDGNARINHLILDHVPLHDGDELRLDTRSYRLVCGEDLEAKVEILRSRYGL